MIYILDDFYEGNRVCSLKFIHYFVFTLTICITEFPDPFMSGGTDQIASVSTLTYMVFFIFSSSCDLNLSVKDV